MKTERESEGRERARDSEGVKNPDPDSILIFPHLGRNKGPFARQTWFHPRGVSANENFNFVTGRGLSSPNSGNTDRHNGPRPKKDKTNVSNRKAFKL